MIGRASPAGTVERGQAAGKTYCGRKKVPNKSLEPTCSPDGAHALVTLLRDRGVDVVTAKDLAGVERALTVQKIDVG